MRLILAGIVLVLAGLGGLLAMVVRMIEPGLALSLLCYGAAFAGAGVTTFGLIRRAQK